MPSYSAPLRDMRFLLKDLWNIEELLESIPAYKDLEPEIFEPILEEAARFAEKELAPLNQIGDKEGCRFNQGEVTTPTGFKEAYRHFAAGGWMSLNAAPEHGGQGLPKMLQILLDEMLCGSNVAFSLYTVLTQGAVHAIELYANQHLKKTFLAKLVSGEWSGTMCLTESHCGTDLGLLRNKATPNADGSYAISGTNIFITSGEHDLTENIIHTVLARLPDAPAGIRGISLFLVPKILVTEDGKLSKRNGVNCGSIEHKMGIKGSATCVLNFENATGYLLGEINQGMKAMFTMMNLERMNIGLQGLGLAEAAYQNALQYAKDRLQGRAASGAKFPDKPADPIIVHPDVRRMLLFMKAFVEGARALSLWTAKHVDLAHGHPDEKTREAANEIVALMTPVMKAFFTDLGFEACNLGLQILGGHGYITEWGMEQFVRDSRIAQIYEGTNGIQALDLVKRKLIANECRSLTRFERIITHFILHQANQKGMQEFIQPLEEAKDDLMEVSEWILSIAKEDPDAAGAAATDYLHILGLVAFAFQWAAMASVALSKKETADGFYSAKIHTARFFMQRVLPRILGHKQAIFAGSGVLMNIKDEEL